MHHHYGWHFLGAFPDNEPNDVGSWLLHADGEALLLEIPPGLTITAVKKGLKAIGCKLAYVTASHTHHDHLDPDVWKKLEKAFPKAEFLTPTRVKKGSEKSMLLGQEPLWMIKAPKHSPSDMITVFRGVAMTGDIELGTAESVNREVARATKVASMAYLRGFQERASYHVHTIMSAHLNDFRQNVHWPDLFNIA